MNYKFDFAPVIDGLPDLLWGCAGTLGLALSGMVLALVIGIGGVMLRDFAHSGLALARHLLRRGDPEYAVPGADLFHLLCAAARRRRTHPTVTAIIALGVNGGAYAIEIIRGGVQSINKGQIEAGFALGLSRTLVFRLIVLKPALRAIFPSLTSQFIMLTLTTSIASAISAYELTSVGQAIESNTFRSFEVYGVVTLMYLIISWMLMQMFAQINARYFSYPLK